MRTFLLVLLLCIAHKCFCSDYIPEWAVDKKGYELLEVVRNHIAAGKTSDDHVKEVLAIIDSDDDVVTLNRFGKNDFPVEDIKGNKSVDTLHIVPGSWLSRADAETRELIARDLHNIVLAPVALTSVIKTRGPGLPVKNIVYDDGVTVIGDLDDDVGVWCYPESYRGEFARAFFYSVAKYPVQLYHGEGANFLDHLVDVKILPSTAALLLEWSEAQSPDAREIERNRTIAKIQGNSNPFVEYPTLARMIWGDSEDDDNGEIEDNNGNIDGNEETGVLKGYYTEADKWIFLYSPYVNIDAKWTIDGEECNTDRISTASLSKGKHELMYRTSGEKGKIIIEIR